MNEENKILLALDQSSKITGYAIFENNVLADSGIISIKDSNFNKRLFKLYNEVKELLINFNINCIIIEDIQLDNSVANNINTFKLLAEVMGILELLFTQLKIPYQIIAPSSWRSKCQIKGPSRKQFKQAAQNFVKKEYGLDVSEDTADAICIGVSTFHKEKNFDWR